MILEVSLFGKCNRNLPLSCLSCPCITLQPVGIRWILKEFSCLIHFLWATAGLPSSSGYNASGYDKHRDLISNLGQARLRFFPSRRRRRLSRRERTFLMICIFIRWFEFLAPPDTNTIHVSKTFLNNLIEWRHIKARRQIIHNMSSRTLISRIWI